MSRRGLVVVGASYAGVHAAISAREAGYSDPVTIVGTEEWLPYERPPLSKAFLLGKAAEQNLILRDRAFFRAKDIDLILGTSAVGIDRSSREVHLNDGKRLGFDRLLLGTGSRARKLERPGARLEGVCYLRSMNDAIDLRERLRQASNIVVVGGGFIGLELAASAIKLGKTVTLVETAARLLERAVSPLVSDFVLDMHRQNGLDVRLKETVRSFDGERGKVSSVTCTEGARLDADLVVVGVGGLPNDELARSARLTCSDGVVVDENGCTSDPDIFAAGDCANHYNAFALAWIRLESVQNAQDQARAAGLAIAGRSEPYSSVPRFWSDQYETKLQTVGFSRGFDAHVVRNSVASGKFSVFYYKASRLIGVESINSPGDQLISRRLIGAGRTPTSEQAADPSFDLRTLVDLRTPA